MSKPLCIDLFCGLGGWSQGFIAEGYSCVGFDIERHDYGTGGYPGDLVLQDVLTLHGSQFKDAAVIVASPPCQKYSYMAMPWSRAKKMRQEYLDGTRSVEELNALFNACFRIQGEACEAAGRDIPLIVENVRGAQEWVGPAKWNYGSFYLWGDVPALMPSTFSLKGHGGTWFGIQNNGTHYDQRLVNPTRGREGLKLPGNNGPRLWTDRVVSRLCGTTKTVGHVNQQDGHAFTRHLTNQREHDGVKQGGDWFGKNCETSISRLFGSKSDSRKAASAQIARIPFALSRHIAQVFKPVYKETISDSSFVLAPESKPAPLF